MFVSIKDQLPEEQANAPYLGGKGYGLYWMAQQGINVPLAFVLPTTVCADYMKQPKTTMTKIKGKITQILADFKTVYGYVPLLSVRSGARVSMPGMMDTILNVGLDDSTESFWYDKLGGGCKNDSYSRLITMYGSVVKGLDRQELESGGLDLYKRKTGEDFPDTRGQILGSIEAVFKSWNNSRAKFYRKMHNIPEEWGTAVVVQAMVFGNLNDQSGTGVLFTRNPDSGENVITGEFLVNAQGEDVVAGIRTPMPLAKMKEWNSAVSSQLRAAVEKLELARKDVQDVEFTIQDGELFILQTRNAKRSARAAVRIAVEMAEEKLITVVEACKRVTAREFDLSQQPVIDPKFKQDHHYTGIPACSGVATGVVVRTSKAAIDCKVPCILVTKETTPEDIEGMHAAVGVLTMTGGSTSHAAVVARGMNKPCVVGLGIMKDHEGEDLTDDLFKDGDTISIDGATGRVWRCAIPVIEGKGTKHVQEFQQMLIKHLGCVPICSTLFESEELMLDLGGPEFSCSPAGAVLAVETVKAALTKCKTLYLDLRQTGRGEIEDTFNRMFPPQISEAALVSALESAVLKDKDRIWVWTNCQTNFKAVVSATNLKTLIMADGLITLPEVKVDAPTSKVLEWKKAEGSVFVSLGLYNPELKSLISPEAALQVVGGQA